MLESNLYTLAKLQQPQQKPDLNNTFQFSEKINADIVEIQNIIGKVNVRLLYGILKKIIRLDIQITQVDKVDDSELFSYLLSGINNHTFDSDFITYFSYYQSLLRLGYTRQRLYRIIEEIQNYKEADSTSVLIDLAMIKGVHDPEGKNFVESLIEFNEIEDWQLEIIKSKSSIDLSDLFETKI